MGILDLTSRALGWFIEQAKKDVRDYNTKRLIREAFSEQPSIRVFARARLKKEQIDIFNELEAMKV